MTKALSDETALLREAIIEVLLAAKEPMTSLAIAETPAVFQLGLDAKRVAIELSNMYLRTKKVSPLKRIPAGTGRSKWEYYNPKVVKLAPQAKAEASPAQGPVNAVNLESLPTFDFNPVEFSPQEFVPAASQVDLPVAVPAGVKSITLTIGGVTIKIDLGV